MTDLLTKKLSAEDFSPEKFVHEVSKNSVGHLDLHEQRQKIRQLAEDTNSQLKKNVYMNYMQFIETAKEISYLESEMYQLSHLITEQKSLLSSLLEVSISGEKGGLGTSVQERSHISTEDLKEKKEKEMRGKLTVLLEKIEGCSHILEVANRHLIYDSDLVELNQDDYSAKQRVHVCLLNDSLMIATWLSDRRGPVRYKFENLFLLDQVLPVNIKDRGSTKNAFKVLIFPDTRVFQAPSSKIKLEWLDQIEGTKNHKLLTDQAPKVEATAKQRLSSMSKDDSLDSNNPFSTEEDDLNPFVVESPPPTFAPPDWVQELPEDLDQATAQRNFEDAVTLIDRGRQYFEHCSNTAELAQMKRALESRVGVLIEVLEGELKVTADKSMQGGPRAARRATNLLVDLGHSMKACKLFLKYRSELLKIRLRRLRLEGKTGMYIEQLCTVFFGNLVETGHEFIKAFPTAKNCRSSFVVWANDEVKSFANIFTRHVFTTQSSLSTVSECISLADEHCSQLRSVGVDLQFALHSYLLRDTERCIADGRDKMIEAVKLRAQEDSWKGLTFHSKEQFERLLSDMKEIGIRNVKSYAVGEKGLNLTDNVIQFSRAFLSYLEDVLRLMWPETENMIDESLSEVFKAQLRHCRNSLDDPLFAKETVFIQKNSCFLLDVVLSVGEHRYAESTGYAHPLLHTFHALRPSLMADHSNNASGTVNKYESAFL